MSRALCERNDLSACPIITPFVRRMYYLYDKHRILSMISDNIGLFFETVVELRFVRKFWSITRLAPSALERGLDPLVLLSI